MKEHNKKKLHLELTALLVIFFSVITVLIFSHEKNSINRESEMNKTSMKIYKDSTISIYNRTTKKIAHLIEKNNQLKNYENLNKRLIVKRNDVLKLIESSDNDTLIIEEYLNFKDFSEKCKITIDSLLNNQSINVSSEL